MKTRANASSSEVMLYTSAKRGVVYAKVQPGQFYVCKNATEITTVLGSCISACIFDPKAGVGGLNHFMLPEEFSNLSSTKSDKSKPSNRFGEHAMDSLLNNLLAAGAQKVNLQAKVFGGAKVLDIKSNIGALNIQFAEEYLRTNQIAVVASDVGGKLPRKLIFEPTTGRVQVHRLRNAYFEHVASKERHYLDRLSQSVEPSQGTNRDH